jgi:hypothetical protein
MRSNSRNTSIAMSGLITPFKIAISDAQLDDLKRRLRATRWPDKETPNDWTQGIPLAYMQEAVQYWPTATIGVPARRASTGSRSSVRRLTALGFISCMYAHRMRMHCRS